MRKLVKHFVAEAGGTVATAETVVLTTLLALAMVVGLTAVRNAITQEFGDIAVALESLNQSYSFTVGTVTTIHLDPPTTLLDPVGEAPAGLNVAVPGMAEQ